MISCRAHRFGARAPHSGTRVRRRRALLAAALVVPLAALSSLAVPGAGARADDRAQPPLPTVELLVGDAPLVAEIAASGEQRYMGLSFRERLDENAGMLFVYPDERPLTFTMRNTLLPLSIAFIGEDLVVDEIVDMDVGPGQLFPSARPARYALEVNQGWFERHGVGPGARVTMR